MEVAAGFKRTEVGVIPNEWAVRSLAAVSEKIMVGIASAATHAYRSKGIPLLRNQNIKNGYLDDSDILFVDPRYESVFRNKRLQAGDLLTARTGYPGVTCVVTGKYEAAQSFTTLITRPNRREIDSEYLCHYINSDIGQNFFEQTKIGGAQKNVNVGALRTMPIPVPQIREQRDIAVVLSGVDDLVAKLDQLIAKKRDIREAATQRLLSGRFRLRGFNEEWETKRLRELVEYEQPTPYLVRSSDYEDISDVPVLTAGKTFILGYTNEKNGVFSNLPVIIFDDFTTASKYVDFPFKAKSSAMKILRARGATAKLSLVFEAMQQIKFPLGDHKRHWISEYQNIGIKLPGLSEQAAVAAILSDMDLELTFLNARRDKIHSLRQGMKQELLTGRIRLVAADAKPEAAKVARRNPNDAANDGHNSAFNEAVVISALAKSFADASHPLSRFRYTKFSYLLHRHTKEETGSYLKKAAGPYNPATRYESEGIAQKSGYIKGAKSGNLHGFVAGENSDKAMGYFEKWYGADALKWLAQFRYEKNDVLELLTTVDKAVEELRAANTEVSVETIKKVILTEPEWAPKLKRAAFSDEYIREAILRCQRLFGTG